MSESESDEEEAAVAAPGAAGSAGDESADVFGEAGSSPLRRHVSRSLDDSDSSEGSPAGMLAVDDSAVVPSKS